MKREVIRMPKFFRDLSRTGLVGVIVAIVALTAGGGISLAAYLGGAINHSGSVNLDQGLAGHWKMDGNAKDDTPYADDGTVTGAALTTDRKGRANSAYSFNGTSDYITIPNSTGLDSETVTVSAWVKASSPPATATSIVEKWNSGGNYPYIMRMGTGGTVGFSAYDGTHNPGVNTGVNVADGSWHLVTGVRQKGTDLKIYLDGILKSTAADTTVGTTSNGESLYVGSRAAIPGTFYGGQIDDVRVYNRVMPITEITALYRSYDASLRAAAGEKGLVGQWKMDGNAKDSSPNANDGSVNGATLTTDRKGTANSAYSFNGATDYITAPFISAYSFGSSPVTMSAWVKLSSGAMGAYDMIISQSSADTPFFELNKAYNDALRVETKRADGSWERAQESIPSLTATNTWYHVVGIYNPSNGAISLYVNGQSRAVSYLDTQSAGNIMASSQPVYIGARAPNYHGTIYGSLDDVRIYNRALSAAEITTQYQSYNSALGLGGAGGAINLGKGLVGEWEMNGNTKDSTPYGNNGSIFGTSVPTSDRKGRANSAYSFNGTSWAVSLPVSAMPSNKITVSTWVNQANQPTGFYNYVNNNWLGQIGSWLLFTAGDGTVYFGVYDGAQHSSGCHAALATGSWHHLVGTYDGTTVKTYYDGALCSGTATTTVALNTVGNPVSVGYGPVGSMDDLRIYNRDLSAAEVAALYKQYK